MIEWWFRAWIFCSVIMAAACGVTPSQAWERDNGGNIADYAAHIAAYRAAGQIKRMDGWYYSAGALWAGYERACIVSGSDTIFILHPVTNRMHGHPAVTPDSPWGFIVSSSYYGRIMSRTPWGARLFAAASARGCFTSPAPCNFYASDLIALGAPVCH
jgi:hypothetical protein